METKPDYVDVKSLVPILTERATKKRIEEFAREQVEAQMDEGFLDPFDEIVIATKLATYFTERVAGLRFHALVGLKGDKRRSALGASVELTTNAGQWIHNDEYHAQLKDEIKFVEEKAKLDDVRKRKHITLAGEEVTIQKSTKKEGGENVKVLL